MYTHTLHILHAYLEVVCADSITFIQMKKTILKVNSAKLKLCPQNCSSDMERTINLLFQYNHDGDQHSSKHVDCIYPQPMKKGPINLMALGANNNFVFFSIHVSVVIQYMYNLYALMGSHLRQICVANPTCIIIHYSPVCVQILNRFLRHC